MFPRSIFSYLRAMDYWWPWSELWGRRITFTPIKRLEKLVDRELERRIVEELW